MIYDFMHFSVINSANLLRLNYLLHKFRTPLDSRLRGNDVNGVPTVIPAKAGIQKTFTF